MTTTAHEDQFGEATEKHIAMYSIEEVLRRNVADLEKELQRQKERAEKAEGELRAALNQEPVAWLIDQSSLITQDSEWARENKDYCHPLGLLPVCARPSPCRGCADRAGG